MKNIGLALSEGDPRRMIFCKAPRNMQRFPLGMLVVEITQGNTGSHRLRSIYYASSDKIQELILTLSD